MRNLQMVDLKGQYNKIQDEIDQAILDVVKSTQYIGGPEVSNFASELGEYLDSQYVIPCANGTDALQVAMMAAGLQPGDGVIVPAFTYVATAEVIALLGLDPIMVDVDEHSFNIDLESMEAALLPHVKAIVPVHLFGQGAQMEEIMAFAQKNDLLVFEDNAQAIGSDYISPDGTRTKLGTIGDISTTSFFPSKNLGCYGDGGAIFTQNEELYHKIKMVANHGQSKRYYHDVIGVNSRLDAIQAAVLRIKLRHLDDYCTARKLAADRYDQLLSDLDWITTPVRVEYSDHVFHQYVIKVGRGRRDILKAHLDEHGIPNNIYYPVPLYKQKAFSNFTEITHLPTTEKLCDEVLALPIHTELSMEDQEYIVDKVRALPV